MFTKTSILAILFFLAGCSTFDNQKHFQQIDHETAVNYVHSVSNLSGLDYRKEAAPKIYIIDDTFAFKKAICGRYITECGLDVPLALYVRTTQTIYVDSSKVSDFPLDAILVHELVHYLQDINHYKASCMAVESQAYEVQFKYMKVIPRHPIEFYAENSCRVDGW